MAFSTLRKATFKTFGFSGAPGWTNLYFDGSATVPAVSSAAAGFLVGIASLFPATWSIQLQPDAPLIDAATGALISVGTFVAPATDLKNGTGAGAFGASSAGLNISWQTAEINRGRIVRGRTFLVPLAAAMYAGDGSIVAGARTDAMTEVTALVASGILSVWSRPRLGVGGLGAQVVAGNVDSDGATLRSRRD